jgi:hypothetical protein
LARPGKGLPSGRGRAVARVFSRRLAGVTPCDKGDSVESCSTRSTKPGHVIVTTIRAQSDSRALSPIRTSPLYLGLPCSVWRMVTQTARVRRVRVGCTLRRFKLSGSAGIVTGCACALRATTTNGNSVPDGPVSSSGNDSINAVCMRLEIIVRAHAAIVVAEGAGQEPMPPGVSERSSGIPIRATSSAACPPIPACCAIASPATHFTPRWVGKTDD